MSDELERFWFILGVRTAFWSAFITAALCLLLML